MGKLSFILMGLLLGGGVQASSLNWETILTYVVNENPRLKAARQDWESAQYGERAAFAAFLPKVSATATASRTGATTKNSSAGAIVTNGVVFGGGSGTNVNNNWVTSLNLTQNLFNGLEDRARVKQAEWKSQNSYWTFVRTKADVSYDLKVAYANLLYAQEYVTLSQDILERRENNYKLVSIRFDSGRENKGSVLLSEANMEQARLDLIRAKDNLRVSKETIKSIMNKDHFEDFEIVGEPPLPNINIPDNKYDELAVETPDYHQALTLERSAEEGIKVVRANFMPNLDIGANVSRQGPDFFPENERWSMALTLTIPIFDGLVDRSNYKAAVVNRYAADERKRSTFLNLIPQMKQAQVEAKQSDIKFKVDSKFKKATETRAEISRAKYNNGLLTFDDWDIIENDLIQKQNTYLQSKRERIIKYAAWEKVIGKGDIL